MTKITRKHNCPCYAWKRVVSPDGVARPKFGGEFLYFRYFVWDTDCESTK